jgi:hypothetical protein
MNIILDSNLRHPADVHLRPIFYYFYITLLYGMQLININFNAIFMQDEK